jgi:large subunit ribosomal protein L24e
VTRTGQLIVLSGSKASSLYHQKKKPALLRWTQSWRRHHKKLNVESSQKKKSRKIVKVARAFVGLSADDLKKKRVIRKAPAATPAAAAEAAAKAGPVKQAIVAEAKAKAKAAQAARKAAGKTSGAVQQKAAKQHAGKGR